ncbi:MAG: hypothetical protein VCC02_09875 [Myxococcota bacterium]
MARRVRRWRSVGIGWGVVVLASGVALAQEASWQAVQPLAAGQRGVLELRFEETRPRGAVQLPVIANLDRLGEPSQSSEMHASTGRSGGLETRQSFALRYAVRPRAAGIVQIPALRVVTDHGEIEVPAAQFRVEEARVAGARGTTKAVDALVSAILLVEGRRPYAGEVFDVAYIVLADPGLPAELLGEPRWEQPVLISNPWSEGESVRSGERTGMRFRSLALAPEAGPVVVPPALQEVAIETGRTRRRGSPFAGADSFFNRQGHAFGSAFDALFDRREKTRVLVRSDPVALDVVALPEPAPADFAGAVGQFALRSRIVPEAPRAGEPVTWTLTLEGRGNWPSGVALPARRIPTGVRTVQPDLEREFNDSSRFEGRLVEDLVLIPGSPGELLLDPVRFVYFDPELGEYRESVVTPPALQVAAGRVAPATHTPAPDPVLLASASQTAESASPRLPAGPRSVASEAVAPLSKLAWAAAGGVPIAALLAYAGFLGLRRARETDPGRPLREAWDEMRAAADVLDVSIGASRQLELRRFQAGAARYFGVLGRAPTAVEIEAGMQGLEPEMRCEWLELWLEADACLYAEDPELPRDWSHRARLLLLDLPRPQFPALRAFSPGNWGGSAGRLGIGLGLLGLLTSGGGVHAGGFEAYRAGDFDAARSAWIEMQEAAPADWTARYNLGLAEAQRGEPGAAVAHTAAAFLAAPRDADVRWNLSVWTEGEGAVASLDQRLAALAFGEGLGALSRQASPFAWQCLGLAGIGGLALAAAGVLRRRHGGAVPGARAGLRGVAAGAAVALALSLFALAQYGPTLDRRAALTREDAVLHTIPTAAETNVNRPLGGGTLVLAGREFLDWVRVELPDGEAGWLRRSELIALWPGRRAR